MHTTHTRSLLAALTLAAVAAAGGCATTSHPAEPSALGTKKTLADLEAVMDEPGTITVESVDSARWAVTRAGLINLEDPQAKAAGLVDGDEPIIVPVHLLHTDEGLFLIDSGVERAVKDDPDHAAVRGIVASVMKMDTTMHVDHDLAGVLHGERPAGVLLTHLHLDHVMGLQDLPKDTPLYVGPGETEPTSLDNVVVAANIDRALAGFGALHEWGFADASVGGVVDVLGDGMLWAIHVPGHTPGSTAYLARTPKGPVLFTGDACHTKWGWEHGVEPGTFSGDRPQSKKSLALLRALAARHPGVDVRLGHQHL